MCWIGSESGYILYCVGINWSHFNWILFILYPVKQRRSNVIMVQELKRVKFKVIHLNSEDDVSQFKVEYLLFWAKLNYKHKKNKLIKRQKRRKRKNIKRKNGKKWINPSSIQHLYLFKNKHIKKCLLISDLKICFYYVLYANHTHLHWIWRLK